MSSPPRPTEDPGLFDDLPLHQKSGVEKPPRRAEEPPSIPTGRSDEPSTPAESLPLFPEAADDEPQSTAGATEAVDATTKPAWRPVVPFPAQISAGLIDLGIVLAVGLIVWLGLYFMGVEIDLVGSAMDKASTGLGGNLHEVKVDFVKVVKPCQETRQHPMRVIETIPFGRQ